MAQPLKWNTPGLKWNKKGVKWNGVATSPTHMNKLKAIIDFTGYVAAELGPVAQTIHDAMVTAAATFTDPPVLMADFQTLITTYGQKLVLRASNASSDVMAFNMARHDLEVALGELGSYVNYKAMGDPVIVLASGFPNYSTTHAPMPAIPAAPANVTIRNGDLSGSFILRCKPDRPGSMNEGQTCTGDPTVEANWHHAGLFPGGKWTCGGLTTGSIVWARVRTGGAGGVMGAWSDPIKVVIM